MSYSRFRGDPATSETTYEYDGGGLLVRSVTTSDPEWTELDRGLLLAWLAEQRDVCPLCGHPMSVCRDTKTVHTWQVVEEICQPSRVAQAVSEGVRESKRRGVVLSTRRTI